MMVMIVMLGVGVLVMMPLVMIVKVVVIMAVFFSSVSHGYRLITFSRFLWPSGGPPRSI